MTQNVFSLISKRKHLSENEFTKLYLSVIPRLSLKLLNGSEKVYNLIKLIKLVIQPIYSNF